MRDCARVRRLLSCYLDRELDAAGLRLVEAHLKTCPLCSKELTGLEQVRRLVAGRKKKSLPQDYLVSRLRRELAGQESAAKRGPEWLADLGNFSRRLIPVPAVAVLLSLILFVFSYVRPTVSYSMGEHLLSGAQTTTEDALELVLGAQD